MTQDDTSLPHLRSLLATVKKAILRKKARAHKQKLTKLRTALLKSKLKRLREIRKLQKDALSQHKALTAQKAEQAEAIETHALHRSHASRSRETQVHPPNLLPDDDLLGSWSDDPEKSPSLYSHPSKPAPKEYSWHDPLKDGPVSDKKSKSSTPDKELEDPLPEPKPKSNPKGDKLDDLDLAKSEKKDVLDRNLKDGPPAKSSLEAELDSPLGLGQDGELNKSSNPDGDLDLDPNDPLDKDLEKGEDKLGDLEKKDDLKDLDKELEGKHGDSLDLEKLDRGLDLKDDKDDLDDPLALPGKGKKDELDLALDKEGKDGLGADKDDLSLDKPDNKLDGLDDLDKDDKKDVKGKNGDVFDDLDEVKDLDSGHRDDHKGEHKGRSRKDFWHIHKLRRMRAGLGSGEKRKYALHLQEEAMRNSVRHRHGKKEKAGSEIIDDHFNPDPIHHDLPITHKAEVTPAKDENPAPSTGWAKMDANGVGGNAGLAKLLGIVFGSTVGFIILFLIIYWLCVRRHRRKQEILVDHCDQCPDNLQHDPYSVSKDSDLEKRGSDGSFSSEGSTLNDEHEQPSQPGPTHKFSFRNHQLHWRDRAKPRDLVTGASINPIPNPSGQNTTTAPDFNGNWDDDFSLAAYRPFSALTTPASRRKRNDSTSTVLSTPKSARPKPRSLRPMYLARLGSGDPLGRPPNIAEIPETISEDKEREGRNDTKTEDWVAEQSKIWKRRFARRAPLAAAVRRTSFNRSDEPPITFLPSRVGKLARRNPRQQRFPVAVASPKKAEQPPAEVWNLASPTKMETGGQFSFLPPLDFSTHPGTRVNLDQGRVRVPSDVLDACLERRRAIRGGDTQ